MSALVTTHAGTLEEDVRGILQRGTPTCDALDTLLRHVQNAFYDFDGSDRCLARYSSSHAVGGYGGGGGVAATNRNRIVAVDRTSPKDHVLRGLNPEDSPKVDEELPWFTVAHILINAVFFPFVEGERDLSDSRSSSSSSSSSNNNNNRMGEGGRRVPFFRTEADTGPFSMRAWRRVYADGLARTLNMLYLGYQSGRYIDALVIVSSRAMLDYLETPFCEAGQCFRALYPDAYDLVVGVEEGVTPLSPSVLTAILAMDTERWVASWFPLLQSLTHGVKVMWKMEPLTLMWEKKITEANNNNNDNNDDDDDLYQEEEGGADGRVLRAISGFQYQLTFSRKGLRYFFYDLHALLKLEVRNKDEKGRFRGVAVPARWMRDFVTWVTDVQHSEVWKKLSPYSAVPSHSSGSGGSSGREMFTWNEEEEEECSGLLDGLLPPPGPIPSLNAVQLTLHNALSESSPVRHVITEGQLTSSFSSAAASTRFHSHEEEDDGAENGNNNNNKEALLLPKEGHEAAVQVVPSALFDFLATHFGAGSKYHAVGVFDFQEYLIKLLQLPCFFTSVNFQVKPEKPSGEDGKNIVRVGKKEVEIVSDNKYICVGVESMPYCKISEVLRGCCIAAVQEGDLSPEEEAIWLSASKGQEIIVGGEKQEVFLRVSFLGTGYFAPPPAAASSDEEGKEKNEEEEAGGGEAVVPTASSSSAVPGAPVVLEEVNVLEETVESVIARIKAFCIATGRKFPIEADDRFIELTLRAEFRTHAPPPPGTQAAGANEEATEEDEDVFKSYYNSTGTTTTTTKAVLVPAQPSEPCLPGTSGLTNVGNTCFMNSALQCLAHLDTFRTKLCGELVSNHRFAQVAHALQDLFVSMWSGQEKVVSTSHFKSKMELRRSRYVGYQQQDANEFIDELLDCVCEELNTCLIPKYRDRSDEDLKVPPSELSSLFWEDFLENRTSFIPKMFFLQSKSRFECATCHAYSVVFEQDSSLTVPIMEVPPAVTVQVMVLVEFFVSAPSPPSSSWGTTTNGVVVAPTLSKPRMVERNGGGGGAVVRRFEVSLRIPGNVRGSVGGKGKRDGSSSSSSNTNNNANPPLPMSRVDQILSEIKKSNLFCETVELVHGKKKSKEGGAAGARGSALDIDEDEDEKEEEGGMSSLGALEYVNYWEHEQLGSSYFVYARCIVPLDEAAAEEEGEESLLSLPTPPTAGGAADVTPPPPALLPVAGAWGNHPQPSSSPPRPAPVAPVYYCLAPKMMLNGDSIIKVLPKLVQVEDIGEALRHSVSGGDAVSRTILKRSRELCEEFLFFSGPRRTVSDYNSSSSSSSSSTDNEESNHPDEMACLVECGTSLNAKEKIFVRPMVLDLAKEEEAVVAAEDVFVVEPQHYSWSTPYTAGGRLTAKGELPVSSFVPLLPRSSPAVVVDDAWVQGYYTRMDATGGGDHTSRPHNNNNNNNNNINMNVTSTVATGREAATTAPAAAAKAPLVVYIFYEEAVCDIKASAVAKTTEKMGYLYAPTDADGSTVGWDSTLEKSLEMAFLTPNTLAGEDSWYCPRCKNFVTAETVRSLFRLPQCLVLSFRRFKQQGYRVMKNSAKIAFPDRLDLKPFLDADADKEQPSSYQLKGVLYHSGTLDYGHYTASAYVSPLQKWVHFNDSHATVTESKSPTRGNAYVLCYEREDVLVKRKQEANPEMDLARIISGGAQA